MASLNGQTIASSYEQLLHVDRDGGGNANTLVSVKDGDNGTTFGIKLATNKVEIIPGSNDANAFEVSQADGTAVFTVNTSTAGASVAGTLTASGDVNFDSNTLFVDASENKVGIGTNSPTLATTQIQDGDLAIVANSADANSKSMLFYKSRNATDAGHTIVQDGDDLGIIKWVASDGGDWIRAAQILAEIDGTPGDDDMPGRIVFQTTPDGGITPVERLRIESNGAFRIGGDGSDQTTKWHSGSAYVNAKLDVRQLAIAFSGTDKVTSDTSGNFTFSSKVGINGAIDSSFAGATIHGTSIIKTTPSDGSENRIKFYTGGAADDSLIQLFKADGSTIGVNLNTNGDSYFNGGDVGINTSNPTNLFTVKSGGAGQIVKGIVLENNGDTNIAGTLFEESFSGGTCGELRLNSSNALKVLISGNSTSYINNGSNFGIGETSPDGKLHIKQATDNGNAIVVDSSTSSARIDVLTVQEAGAERWALSFEGESATNSLTLNSNSTSNIIHFAPDGNVGIGTQNPRSKFHVEDATNRGVRFFSKSTTGIGAGSQTTTIGTFTTKYDGTGNGHACMVDAVVTARVSQGANHTSIRTVGLRILIARSGNEGGGDNTNSNVSIIETTNSVIAETGSAGTMKSISFAAAFTSGTNSSSSSHGVEIQATTDIDTGSGCAIDFIGMIYGHETIEFS
jgi:hypothetical protein